MKIAVRDTLLEIEVIMRYVAAAWYCIMSHMKHEITWNWDYWLHSTLDANKTCKYIIENIACFVYNVYVIVVNCGPI